jgi:Protein of unknown function (DUF2656)
MTKLTTGRMLLSHNFDISEEILPKLSREEFTQVFIDGLSSSTEISCRRLNHPHWMVEIIFPINDFSPSTVGSLCAKALLDKRLTQKKSDESLPDLLILGGLKTTPPLSHDPDALQGGEWGVDVVETQSAESFLIGIEWKEKTANKTIDQVFKVEIKKK